ncbi:MAG: oxidoreductase transition metal ion binding [Trebouxia sp. A1-2]|nr:MAG: oxidoreductase transition metal ion binding [Trebouxia sp. A1-2]
MAANGMSVTDSTQAAATVMQINGDGHEAHAASEPEAMSSCTQEAKGTSGRMALHDWQADAVKYDTVEEWFHGLVRAHFKGSLKPPFNEEARAAAGFGPEWYLPLSSVILQ